ncbi:hypothetical protein JCM5296_000291 [Sporobolomyces johnsonii]
MLLPALGGFLCLLNSLLPSQQIFSTFCSPSPPTAFSSPYLADQGSEPRSSFSPLLPPAIPLAVKSPYLNAWLSTGGDRGSRGYLAGNWAQHWPIHYPGSDKDYRLSWAGMISVDGTAYEFLGAPVSDLSASDVGKMHVARQIAFEYTATRSVFSFLAGGVAFNATFLSPVTPNDELRLSLPFSYLSVDVDPAALKKHDVMVYTDISGEWASGDSSANITWDFKIHNGAGVHSFSRKDPLLFGEFGEQAEWGSVVYATMMGNGAVASSGSSKLLRASFVAKGRLSGTQDIRFRAINDDLPVFGFSIPLSVASPRAVFTIGHVRDPYVNYVTPHGQLALGGLWTTRFPHFRDAVSFFQRSFPRALAEARQFDAQVRCDAQRVSSDDYAAIVELSTRQAFATFELTTGVTPDWKKDQGGMMAFLKELSSNGDAETIDVIFPLHPVLLYANPTLLALLLEPLLVYTHSGLYPNRWPVHDLGTYPNATGYNAGNDEPMPVEEAGNMLWMALSYFQLTADKPWVEKHYSVFKQWTTFLVDDGLVPAEQLSTDDFAGTLSNQTDLAVKAIVGIGAMAELAKQTGRWTDWVHYRAVAKAYVKEWSKLALTGLDSPHPHVKLTYQDKDSWGLLYNLFGDRILALDLFPRELYEWQSAWYSLKQEKYGVPLDSRHPWTKTDWEVFAAASATDKQTRDMFIDLLVKYLKEGKVDAAFPDLYETPTANWPGQDGLDWPIYFIARPVVGAHFALLALEKANGANGVVDDPFRGKDKLRGLVDQSGSRKLRWKRDV